jgi:hypothetical protein
MRVLVTPEAAALLVSRKTWWRVNRPATADLFEREFLDAVAVIGERPALFPVTVKVGGREIRREAAGVVKIVSAWGAVRGKPPQL